jgi:hypothetical protein
VLAGEKFAAVFPGRHSALAIADRPPSEWGPPDLGTVTEALASPAGRLAAARPLLGAGLACRGFLRGTPVRDDLKIYMPNVRVRCAQHPRG